MFTDTHSHSCSDSHDSHDAHTHGAVDLLILTTDRGIWALKWSLLGLLATALFQIAIVWLSGSVALLADTIHNFGDAATAVPLGAAFRLARVSRVRLAEERLAPYGKTYLDNLTQSAAFTRRAYEVGDIGIFEFSVAQDRLTQARFQYLDTVLAFRQATVALDAQTAFQCMSEVGCEVQKQ